MKPAPKPPEVLAAQWPRPARIGIVVPCYNEAARLDADAFQAFAAAHSEIAFCFVDDGSADGTAERIAELARAGGLALSLPENRGKAEAVRQGMLRLCEEKAVEYAGYWDADLATPLDAILPFAEKLDADPECDAVLGCRVQRLGADIRRNPLRHYAGRVFATFASIALGLAVYDTQCGAKLFRKEIAADLFEAPFVSPWLFDVEWIGRYERKHGAEAAGVRLCEWPLQAWRDAKGSKVTLAAAVRAPLELWAIRRRLGPPQPNNRRK